MLLLSVAGTGTWAQEQSDSAAKKPKAAVPVTMTECEGKDNCATWTFLGAQGTGKWPSGEISSLMVKRYDDNSVVIERSDSTGPSAGLTAVYTGTRHGDRVGGEFTSSWPGHWDSKTENWYAMVEKDAVTPPSIIHICIAHCFSLVWEDGHYVNSTSQNKSIYTVESFTRQSVILHRTDTGSFPLTATLTGQLSRDGDSIVNGVIEWTSGNSGKGPFQAAWGNAEHTVPWSDEERAARGLGPAPRVVVPVVVPAVCIPWFFGVVCG